MRNRMTLAVLGSIGIAALIAGCATSAPGATDATDAAVECPTATVGTLDDDSTRAAFYAIDNGIVSSDLVTQVDVSYLTIPAAIQAMGTDQYAYLNATLPGLLFARKGGLDVRSVAWIVGHTGGGLALYAKADSGISSPEDLVGKRVSIASFGSTAAIETQIVLEGEYGLDPAFDGGDFTWVELDPPTQLNALEKGDVDAAILWHQAAWMADNNPEFEKVTALDQDFKELSGGAWPIGAFISVQGEYADEHPECVAEFQRMVEESVAYAEENHHEIGEEIAGEYNVSVEFIDYWWDPAHYQYGGVIDDTWNGYAESFYDLAFEYGYLDEKPNLDEIIVQPKS